MLKKAAAITLAAGALVFAAPAASFAADPYVGPPSVAVDGPIIDVCNVSTVSFGAGYFVPGEVVGISIAGASAETAQYSGNTAMEDGSLVLTFIPPADGQGAYAVTFAGAERSYTATITVQSGTDAASSCDHDPSVGAGSSEATSGDAGLAVTGGDISPWIVGGGALGVAAGGVLVAAGVRRKRA
ncbi:MULTISPECIES: hypothetical protein [Microbacterium]|uniref:hypothetical protein n=1 Tax=Microbacterium TaxID=33882 RepID=UPI0022F0840A|nr:hypothetical protein [Streptomyces sp. MS2A]